MTDTDFLSLQQLSDATGIEPRTIRSYIERGILPGPDVRGRHSAYSRETLARLRVLALIRDARRDISLDQIRVLMAQLSPSQIHGIAEGRIRIGGLIGDTEPETANRPGSTSAIEYLTQIRKASAATPPRSLRAAPAASMAFTPPAAADHLTPLDQMAAALSTLVPAGSSSRLVRSETWHRVAITHDIELAIRGEFSADQIAQLHRIGDMLRVLLTKGVSR
jgi:DNA-binding transcriptional MerR regulator